MSSSAQGPSPRGIEAGRDHVRGGAGAGRVITMVSYGDFLCPYCRRFRAVLLRLRGAFGERIAYAFRHFPNERAHPGAELMARAAEAAALQGRFWEMHDALFDREPPISAEDLPGIARGIGLDIDRFEVDLDSDGVRARVESDLAAARREGVTGTPTLYIDGMRYDGAWDFHSLLDVVERPMAERIHRSARAFVSLPASGGLALLLAALAALVLANSPLAPFYQAFVEAPFGIGSPGSLLSLSVGEWLAEGLLGVFFLLVGLEIRRELTAGTLADPRAAALPVLAALGGVVAPALVYLAVSGGQAVSGWAIPTATDIAFTLGVLALLGDRVPPGLKVFVAALAIVDDVISVLTLAIFYPQSFSVGWLLAALVTIAALYALRRWRVYRLWPYCVVIAVTWFCFHAAGIHGALAGIVLAAILPTRPTPAAGPLLAQAATALAALEHAEREAAAGEDNPLFDWASRNLSAASDRLLSPADRVEQAVAPWSAYFVLPLFAFSATGVALQLDASPPQATGILWGVILGLVLGKPLGICLLAWVTVKSGLARLPEAVGVRQFVGAACLCGIGYTMALLMADEAFPDVPWEAATAKIAVLAGSTLAAALGAAIILLRRSPGKYSTADLPPEPS